MNELTVAEFVGIIFGAMGFQGALLYVWIRYGQAIQSKVYEARFDRLETDLGRLAEQVRDELVAEATARRDLETHVKALADRMVHDAAMKTMWIEQIGALNIRVEKLSEYIMRPSRG